MIGGIGRLRDSWADDLPGEVSDMEDREVRQILRGAGLEELPIGRTIEQERAMRQAAAAITNPRAAVLVEPAQQEQTVSLNARPTKVVQVDDGSYQYAYDTDEEDRRARGLYEAVSPPPKVVRQANPVDAFGERVGVAPIVAPAIETPEAELAVTKAAGLADRRRNPGELAFEQAMGLMELSKAGVPDAELAQAATMPQAQEIFRTLKQDEARTARRRERLSPPSTERRARLQQRFGPSPGSPLSAGELAAGLSKLAILGPQYDRISEQMVEAVRAEEMLQGSLDLGPKLTRPIEEVPLVAAGAVEEVPQRRPFQARSTTVLQPALMDTEGMIARRLEQMARQEAEETALLDRREALKLAASVALEQPPARRQVLTAAPARAGGGVIDSGGPLNQAALDNELRVASLAPDDIRMTDTGIWPEAPTVEGEVARRGPDGTAKHETVDIAVLGRDGQIGMRRVHFPYETDPDTGEALNRVQARAREVLAENRTPVEQLESVMGKIALAPEARDNYRAAHRKVREERGAGARPMSKKQLRLAALTQMTGGGAVQIGQVPVDGRLEDVYLPRANDDGRPVMVGGKVAARIGSALPYRDYDALRAGLRGITDELGIPSAPGLTPRKDPRGDDPGEGGKALNMHTLARLASDDQVSVSRLRGARTAPAGGEIRYDLEPLSVPQGYPGGRAIKARQEPLVAQRGDWTGMMAPDPFQRGGGPRNYLTAKVTEAATGPLGGLTGERVQAMTRRRYPDQAPEAILQAIADADARFARPEAAPQRVVEGLISGEIQARRRRR